MFFDWRVAVSSLTIIGSILIMILAYIKSGTRIIFAYRFLFAIFWLSLGLVYLNNSYKHFLSDLTYNLLTFIGFTSLLASIALIFLNKKRRV